MSRTGMPTHEDAQLVLRLYELRRDEKLREARNWFNSTFLPTSIDEIREVILGRTQENTYFRMVVSYWDMAASFIEYGVMNGELFLESGGEMLLVWAKIEQFVPQIRQEMDLPSYLVNIEKVIARSQWAQERLRWFHKRIDERKAAARPAPAAGPESGS